MAQRNRKLLWGGNGDGGDDYFDTGKFDRLLEIKIRHGGAIDAMIVKYVVDGQILTRHFGGRGGKEEDTITLEDGDFLTKIAGNFSPAGDSAVIRSLTFYTSSDNMFGPYGAHGGTAFALPVVKGSIVGFFGYAGTFLDAIGVHVTPNKS